MSEFQMNGWDFYIIFLKKIFKIQMKILLYKKYAENLFIRLYIITFKPMNTLININNYLILDNVVEKLMRNITQV